MTCCWPGEQGCGGPSVPPLLGPHGQCLGILPSGSGSHISSRVAGLLGPRGVQREHPNLGGGGGSGKCPRGLFKLRNV